MPISSSRRVPPPLAATCTGLLGLALCVPAVRAADAFIPVQDAPAAFYCGSAPGPAVRASTLAELVATGMKENSETRVAWTQAEDAALELGIVRSKYGPILAAQAVTLYDHAALPLPKNLAPDGYFKSDAEALVPQVSLKWRLYDGGGKQAALDGAAQMLARAHFGFTAAHRRITILITQQYYRLAGQVARRDAAAASLQSMVAVEQLARARQARGLGTVPETLQAAAQVAEARLRVEEADAAAQEARMALLEASGIRPDGTACIAVPAIAAEPAAPQPDIEQLVARAIATRPEVGAAMAQLRAGEADIALAQSAYGPTVSLVAHAGQNMGRMRSGGGEWSSVHQPVYGIGLTFEIPLYDGRIRSSNVRLAQSKAEAAQAQLDGMKNKVIHEVIKASHDVEVAQRRGASSAAALAAATASFDATFASYRRGLSTMPELQSAAASLARSRTAGSEAGADLLTARAVLAFAGGDLVELEP